MALVIEPVTAAAIVLPILIAMDAVAVWKFRHSWEKKHLIILLPAAIIGMTIASFLMGSLSTDALKIIIGVIAVSFCMKQWFFSALSQSKPGRIAGYFWGFIAGFTSMQIHAGGLPSSIYLLAQKMDKMRLMGTNALFFTVLNLLKLIPYSLLGQFDKTNLITSLILMPLAPIGVLLGYQLLKIVKESIIYTILSVFLCMAGIKLIIDGAL